MTGTVVVFEHGGGERVEWLPRGLESYTVVRRAEGEPAPDRAEPGTLVMTVSKGGAVPGAPVLVAGPEGWHWCRGVSASYEDPETVEERSWGGDTVLRYEVGPATVRVELDGLTDAPVRPFAADVAAREPRGRHAEGQELTVDGVWVCAACGAASADRELFLEAGCA